jgi:hypothetical protein
MRVVCWDNLENVTANARIEVLKDRYKKQREDKVEGRRIEQRAEKKRKEANQQEREQRRIEKEAERQAERERRRISLIPLSLKIGLGDAV